MTTPKSPEQIMEEFVNNKDIFKTITREEVDWLRSSMVSLLCYMAERMPTKISTDKKGFDGYRSEGYNMAVENCRTLFIEEARKITNNE